MIKYKSIEKETRVILVDALRGYALMGLFFVHMVEYFELYWYKPEASIYNDLVFGIFGGKAYAIFALLFGFSFYIIMSGNEKKGIAFRQLFSWRLVILLVAGLIHGVIYGGDILQVLAVIGLLLIPFYKIGNKMLVIISVMFLLQTPAIIYLISYTMSSLSEPNPRLFWSFMGHVHEVYATGSFSDVLSVNIFEGLQARWTFLYESGRMSVIIGMSMIGFYWARNNFFDIKKMTFKSLLFYIVFVIIGLFVVLFLQVLFSRTVSVSEYRLYSDILNSYRDVCYIFLTVFVFYILFKINIIQKILNTLSCCGRMSLTIYVTQSLIFVPVFYNFGFGTYAYWGQTFSFYLAIVLWTVQMFLSRYWMMNFYYGPFEWLWRAATYRTVEIPFKR